VGNDWIKMRVNLQTHPKVVRISSALKADSFGIIGGLHAAWSIFDAHSEDGGLLGYTCAALDMKIGWPGFSAALESVGWLETRSDGLFLPRFDAHNGKSAKRRAEDRVRKMSARAADNVRTDFGLEKRREEEEELQPPLPPSGERVVASPGTNGHGKKRQPFEPKHPRTRELCEAIDHCRQHWRADAKLLATGEASLRAMDGLLVGDGRDPERVVDVLGWLFSGEPGDYDAPPGRFDWRRAIKTAAALRRNWDAIVDERESASLAEGTR